MFARPWLCYSDVIPVLPAVAQNVVLESDL